MSSKSELKTMGVLNTTQIKTLKRMAKYVGEMSEATMDLSNDCNKIATNKPKGSNESKAAQELIADLQVVNFLFDKITEKLNSISSKENENENSKNSN